MSEQDPLQERVEWAQVAAMDALTSMDFPEDEVRKMMESMEVINESILRARITFFNAWRRGVRAGETPAEAMHSAIGEFLKVLRDRGHDLLRGLEVDSPATATVYAEVEGNIDDWPDGG